MTDQEKQELKDKQANIARFLKRVTDSILKNCADKIVLATPTNSDKVIRKELSAKWTFEVDVTDVDLETRKTIEQLIIDELTKEIVAELTLEKNPVQLVSIEISEVLIDTKTYQPFIRFYASIIE